MKTKADQPFKCNECGKAMSLKAATRAMDLGCPKCGGSDVGER